MLLTLIQVKFTTMATTLVFTAKTDHDNENGFEPYSFLHLRNNLYIASSFIITTWG